MLGTWTRVAIADKPADVFDPPGTPRFALLDLHPLGGPLLPGSAAFTRVLADLGLAAVCPHGGESWWADRVCPPFDPARTAERHVLDHVLPFVRGRWGFGPPAVGLTGVGMGGQGALRLAFKHPRLFPAVAAVAPALEYHERYGRGTPLDEMYDSKEQARQDTAILHVHPAHQPPHLFFCVDPTDREWWRGNDRLHEKLNALGVPHEADLTTRGGGHTAAYFDAMAERAVRAVVAGLQEQAKRLY
ncbi:MAG: alpha/beta hydrolase-fold protein [Gemmataceae bacterium]